MKRIVFMSVFLSVLCVTASGAFSFEREAFQLPAPERTGGKPLMQALSERMSDRSFSDTELTDQELSNLLWAANGVNREKRGGRTVPSAFDLKEIDILVAKRDGVFLYNAHKNSLEKFLADDIRQYTGKQSFTQEAPINLIYVAHYGRMKHPFLADEQKDFYAAVDTGFISQNVYLYCASQGLSTVVLGWVDKEELHARLGLDKNQKVILTQPVGYPKK